MAFCATSCALPAPSWRATLTWRATRRSSTHNDFIDQRKWWKKQNIWNNNIRLDYLGMTKETEMDECVLEFGEWWRFLKKLERELGSLETTSISIELSPHGLYHHNCVFPLWFLWRWRGGAAVFFSLSFEVVMPLASHPSSSHLESWKMVTKTPAIYPAQGSKKGWYIFFQFTSTCSSLSFEFLSYAHFPSIFLTLQTTWPLVVEADWSSHSNGF